MPSIQDVADQINAKLDEVITNTAQNVVVTGEVRDELHTLNAAVTTLDSHLVTGLNNLGAGLFAMWEVQKAALSELRHHSEQHDTMICLQRNTNELLCGITRKLTDQLAVSRAMAGSLRRVEGIAERAQPAAAGDYDRLEEVRERMLECCPPQPPEPEPCPTDCPAPKHDPYDPRGQDWKPRTDREPVG